MNKAETKEHDKLMWAIIESLNWAGRCNESRIYDTIKMEFMHTYTEETAKKVNDFVTARFKQLYEAYDKHIADGGESCGHFGGDDSFGDMLHHVIGMGKKTFNAVMKDMTKLNGIKFVESFSYALPHTNETFNDYKNLNEDFHIDRAKQSIKALADVVTSGEPIGADKARTIKELFSRFMSIIESNNIDAFGDLDFDTDYKRFSDLDTEYHALFANYLFDAKKYLEKVED